MFKKILVSTVFISCLSAVGPAANAAGFYIQEQSVSGLGASFAGQAAMPRDSSTVYFNPAGMTYLSGPQIQVNANVIYPTAEMTNTGSNAFTGINPGTGAPTAAIATGGHDGDDPYDPTLVPNIFAAYPLNDRTWLGLAVTAPFGLASDYGDTWWGRYDSTETSLKTIDIAPSLAYQVNNKLSIGGGISAQYVDVSLKNAVFNPAIGIGNTAVQPDGHQNLHGDNWSWGWNIGLMYEPRDDLRVGLTYRSEVDHNIKGTSDRSGIGAVLQGAGTLNGSFDGTANLDLPDMAQLGVAYDYNDRLTLMGGLIWFGWSDFEDITVVFDNGAQDTSVTPQNYNDTFAWSLGFEYKMTDDFTLRSGLQIDATPTDDNFRTSRTPDGDRKWISAGGTYSINDRLDLDFAATFITVEESEIDVTRNGGLANVQGTADGNVVIGALGLTYKF